MAEFMTYIITFFGAMPRRNVRHVDLFGYIRIEKGKH